MIMDKTVVLASLLRKFYQIGDVSVEALRDVNLKVEKGEFVIIKGPSGAEKTTLLNIMGARYGLYSPCL